MNTSVAGNRVLALAAEVWFTDSTLNVRLLDGRELAVPIEWFPRLRDATGHQRADWRLVGRGIGIHWEELDEDIAVAALLRT